jgi:hypothetical protein
MVLSSCAACVSHRTAPLRTTVLRVSYDRSVSVRPSAWCRIGSSLASPSLWPIPFVAQPRRAPALQPLLEVWIEAALVYHGLGTIQALPRLKLEESIYACSSRVGTAAVNGTRQTGAGDGQYVRG